MSRRGKLIYRFFSADNMSMNMVEGLAVAVLVFLFFFSVYGLMFWTSNKSALVTAFIFAMCSAGAGLA